MAPGASGMLRNEGLVWGASRKEAPERNWGIRILWESSLCPPPTLHTCSVHMHTDGQTYRHTQIYGTSEGGSPGEPHCPLPSLSPAAFSSCVLSLSLHSFFLHPVLLLSLCGFVSLTLSACYAGFLLTLSFCLCLCHSFSLTVLLFRWSSCPTLPPFPTSLDFPSVLPLPS